MIVALAFALASQAATAPAPAAAVVAKQRVLVLDLRNDGAKPEHARLVTDNIVVSLSRFTQLEVVSSEDVRRMMQTEGEKQAMGCTDESCLTEIASAMGASLVVHGSIGRLESITVVNLSLYDSKAGKSIGREAIQVQRLDDLPYRVEDATARLVRPLLGATPAQNPSQSSSSSAPPSSGTATPPPDAGGMNRVLAAGVGGAAGCCLAGGLFFVGGAFLAGCGTCVVGPLGAALGGAGAPLIGGTIGGAKTSSLILPALVGAGVAGISGLVTGLIVFSITPGDRAVFPYVQGIAIGAIPVGLLTGAAVAIATGLGADDPDPPASEATAERAPEELEESEKIEKRAASRYAMAY